MVRSLKNGSFVSLVLSPVLVSELHMAKFAIGRNSQFGCDFNSRQQTLAHVETVVISHQ